MTGFPRTTRRAAKPVRIAFAKAPDDTGVDGAWWPHTSAMAMELPDLVGALYPQLGEVVAIRVNWTSTQGQRDLETMVHASHQLLPGENRRRPRLMGIDGSTACTKLLVVPSMTSQALGVMLMRTVAGLPVATGSGDGRLYETARAVLGLAAAECEHWSATMTLDSPVES